LLVWWKMDVMPDVLAEASVFRTGSLACEKPRFAARIGYGGIIRLAMKLRDRLSVRGRPAIPTRIKRIVEFFAAARTSPHSYIVLSR
jgi:hypothetical protein